MGFFLDTEGRQRSLTAAGATFAMLHANSDTTYGYVGDANLTDRTVGKLTGTVSATNTSTAVVGVETLFTKEVASGGAFRIGSDSNTYTVSSVTDDTHLTLTAGYVGTATAQSAYQDKKGLVTLRLDTSGDPGSTSFQTSILHLEVKAKVVDTSLAIMGLNDGPGDWCFVECRANSGTGIAIDSSSGTTGVEHYQGKMKGASGFGVHIQTLTTGGGNTNILCKLEEVDTSSTGNRALDIVAKNNHGIILRRDDATNGSGYQLEDTNHSVDVGTYRQVSGLFEIILNTTLGNSGTATSQFQFLNNGKLNFANVPTTTTAPAAGGAGALPATPAGYMTIQVAGADKKVAYY